MRKKKVSIAVSIPVFNRLELLKRTLKSVFSQTEEPDEIIVVDNCSTDGTWEYLKTLPSIKAYRNKKNIGAIKNYNETIRRAKSDYVVSLASDDIILPDYIKTWKEIIERSKSKAAAYFSAGYIIDENDRIKGLVKPFPKDLFLVPPKTLKMFWDHFRFYISLSGWTVYKREVFEKVGFFTKKYHQVTENEMSMKILPNFPVYYCAKPLFAYRIHALQAFKKEPGDASYERPFMDLSDVFRVFFDYEKKPPIKRSFTEKEQRDRIFVRKPIAFLLPQSLYRFLLLDFRRARSYFKLFTKHYPKPILSFVTLKLVLFWSIELFNQFIKNTLIKLKFRNRNIFEQDNREP